MFIPKRVVFEEKALEYNLGKDIFNYFKDKNVEIIYSKSGRIVGIPGKSPEEMYFQGKSTLVVGIRKSASFQSCKPSANYQLPLCSGCMGMCEYCYLNTQMGKKPYVKVYVNLDEILNKAKEYEMERYPDVTVFEGAATSDPVPVELYTGALKKAIEFFGLSDNSYFRFVTKFTDIDSLLHLKHNGKTTIRFSINTDRIITQFEHKTPKVEKRLNAAFKVVKAGYNLGFIVAPVFLYSDWKEEYKQLLDKINNMFSGEHISFEIISHRFTKRAKENILKVYSKTKLPMEEELRKFKYGQFGYGKYIYKQDELQDMKKFFDENIAINFGADAINYII
ncbi:spore photoproduct lyase [Clostridium sp. WILCCON 0269]|uniref:Spore photoproduct lyase n=1 Tax=Candidatus Clostridium eludens TaxID=3381663 RepID=A0ABW8SGY2_9CLOT